MMTDEELIIEGMVLVAQVREAVKELDKDVKEIKRLFRI